MNESPFFGGAEVAFLALARALARCASVSLATPPWPAEGAPFWQEAQAAGLRLFQAPGPLAPNPLGRLARPLRRAAARRVGSIIAQARPDVLLFNLSTVERGAAILDAAAASVPRLRVAGYLHLAHPPSVIGARYAGWLRDQLAPANLRRYDTLLAVSRATAEVATSLVGRPVSVVYEAVPALTRPPILDRATARARLGLAEGPTVGLIGRVICRQKGHDTAVRVAAELRRRGLRPTWVVVGDGPDLPRVKRLVRQAGLSDCVRFAGWRTDALEVLPAFDVVALPSRFEGMPLVAVEAMHARVPVVAFAVDGVRELLGPPFAVPPEDEDAFARALEAVLAGSTPWPAEAKADLAMGLCHPDAVASRLLEALALD